VSAAPAKAGGIGWTGLTLLFVGAVLAGSCGDGALPSAERFGIRHVVLISIDTLRADHLGCYGHAFVESPHLDGLAMDGILFEQHVSAASTTLASHTSMLTGTYPHTHGVARNGFFVAEANRMLAELLLDAGFETAGFIGAAPLESTVNFDQGFEHYDHRYTTVVDPSPSGYQRRAAEVTDAVIDWLEQSGAGESRPLFLFVHYFDPHAPYDAPEPWGGMYRKGDVELEGLLEGLDDPIRAMRQFLRLPEPDPERRFVERIRARAPDAFRVARALDAEYGAEISYTDHHVGRLFEALERAGVWDDALVVVTSDHGETLYEHTNVFDHGDSVYDTEVRTPLIVRLPGGRHGGKRSERLVSSIDLVPTILDAVGLAVPPVIEGQSFVGEIAGTLPPREPVFAEATKPWGVAQFSNDPVWPNRGKFQCVRTERYKYMFRIPDGQFRLYDLAQDAFEQNDLLGVGPAPDDLARELDAHLRRWRDSADPAQSELVSVKEQLDALRSLGYLGGAN
jgi:arylsulfatase